MFNMDTHAVARLKKSDRVEIEEPELDQDAIRSLLGDTNCPIDAVPTLLALVDQPTGFTITYTTATRRQPEASMRRRYAKPKAGQVSVQTLPKVIRERLLPQQVFEADIQVAAFAMFQGIYLEAGRSCPYITEYCQEKTRVRTWLAEETRLSVNKVKECLSAMHACVFYVWPRHNSAGALTWIASLRDEIKGAYNILKTYSPVFNQHIAEAKKYKSKNIEGTAMSMFRELQERRVIDALREYLDVMGLATCGLVHDAVLFTAEISDEELPELKREAESFISHRVQMPILLDVCRVRKNTPLPPLPLDALDLLSDVTMFPEERRLKPIEFHKHEDVKCLVISAPMNMGKTFALRELMVNNPDTRFLFNSTRILHAITSKGSLWQEESLRDRIIMYRDEGMVVCQLRDSSKGKIVIVQNESLHKLLENTTDENGNVIHRLHAFDVVVCDEIRSLLKQTVSEKTHGSHLQQNQSIFQQLCQNAHCIFSDADVMWDNTVARFCRKELGGLWSDDELEVHHYSYQTLPRVVKITFEKEKFQAAVKAAVRAARREREQSGRSRPVILNCMSKARVEWILCRLFPRADNKLPEQGDNFTWFFTGDSNDNLDIFEDINQFVRERPVDLIAHSPKLTVGCSLEEPVTAVFCDASEQGCVVRDWGQGCGRARNVDGACLHVLMPRPKAGGAYSDQEIESKVEERLNKNEKKLVAKLESFFPNFDFIGPEAKDSEDADGAPVVLQFKSRAIAPSWVKNCVSSKISEEDRSKRNMSREILRLFQFKGWTPEFVDIEDCASGFYPAAAEADKKKNRAASKQKSNTRAQRWTLAHQEKQKLAYDELLVDLRSDRDKWDKATALLHQQFPNCREELKAEHAKWFSVHRASLFHARTLTMSEEEVEHVDLTNTLFAFRKKNLMTTKQVGECLTALAQLLAVIHIPFESFLAADGSFVVELSVLEGNLDLAKIRQLADVIFNVVWAPKQEWDTRVQSALALIRRVFRKYGRMFVTPDSKKRAVTRLTIKLDPMFAFLHPRFVPRADAMSCDP